MTLQAPLLTSSVDELVSLRPSELRQHDAGDPAIVEALIEEARRRTRRRRRRYGACALLAAAAVALFGFEHSGGGSSGSALDSAPPARPPALPAVHALRGNGALTIMVGGNGEGHSGIFEVARDGHLRSVFPCVRPCYELESADWSPDGKRLAFAVTTISVGSAYDGLHIIDKATGNDLRVPLFGFMFGLDWSPNGDRLAYVATNGNPHFGRIYIEPTDWSRPQLLRTGSAGLDSSPSWSPDGKRIAFASQVTPYAKHKSVYVIDVDGHHRRLLARNGSAPAWSPDGTRIAFHTSCGGVRLISPAGQDVTPLRGPFRCRAIGATAGAPVWSPDGKKLTMSNSSGVYVVNADGTGLTRRTTAKQWVFGVSRPSRQPRTAGDLRDASSSGR